MQDFKIRLAQKEDVTQIYNVIGIVESAITDKNLFVADDLESINQHISNKGFTLLAEYDNSIIAFLIVRIPREEKDNLGLDIGLEYDVLLKIAHMESVVVLPQYRGKGLQSKLLHEAERLLLCKGYTHFLATVYPDNNFSLNNFINLGYKVMKTTVKYGGKKRHILLKIAIES
jgi:ribosomal protein S18 acetylase RimI-like enzyme